MSLATLIQHNLHGRCPALQVQEVQYHIQAQEQANTLRKCDISF